jgi:putative phosphoesterase
MKFIVTADTHIPRRARALPMDMLAAFEVADHIIHAGDFTAPEVLDVLMSFAPVTAVAGNADGAELLAFLGERQILGVNGFRIGVCHGHGAKGRTLDRALAAFSGQSVNAIVFGHSHIPYLSYHDGVLVLNPGSPTDRRRSPRFSYGVIEVGDTITARIVYFEKDGRNNSA